MRKFPFQQKKKKHIQVKPRKENPTSNARTWSGFFSVWKYAHYIIRSGVYLTLASVVLLRVIPILCSNNFPFPVLLCYIFLFCFSKMICIKFPLVSGSDGFFFHSLYFKCIRVYRLLYCFMYIFCFLHGYNKKKKN